MKDKQQTAKDDRVTCCPLNKQTAQDELIEIVVDRKTRHYIQRKAYNKIIEEQQKQYIQDKEEFSRALVQEMQKQHEAEIKELKDNNSYWEEQARKCQKLYKDNEAKLKEIREFIIDLPFDNRNFWMKKFDKLVIKR